jgi:hypothetical protein
MEEFDEVDPYTKGERELEKRLGYAKFGFLPWRGTEDSVTVRENMGGVPMLWAETEHFRIGSSLGTYKIPNDREERERLKGELARLKNKLGKLRAPKKELDPYLRLHLYAQRAEDAYAAFVTDFALSPADYEARGPILGLPNKILLLLCERKSEFGRYLRTYENSDIEFSYRTGWLKDGLLVAANVEAIGEHWKDEKEAPIDSMFHCMLVSCLASDLIDGWGEQMFKAPVWLTYAYGHYCLKRIDSRWPVFDGRKFIYDKEDDSWNWQPRVRNLVKNEFFAGAEAMFAWKEYGDLNVRDHMVAWSKLEFLLAAAEGDPKGFLTAVCRPLDAKDSRNLENEPVARQTRALLAHFGLTAEEFDAAWSEWVEKTYDKK